MCIRLSYEIEYPFEYVFIYIDMKTVVIGMLGTNLDRRGGGSKRWHAWRPTVSLCQHDDFVVDRLELLLEKRYLSLAEQVTSDIETVSPETKVVHHVIEQDDPWDFANVYEVLRSFTDNYPFDIDSERYLVHMTTGTHVAQICWFLLTEARYIPGTLIQTSPPNARPKEGDLPVGQYHVIDLDLSKYDQIASRFRLEQLEGTEYLKQGIQTRNKAFNAMIEQIEKVSIRSSEPILLTGPTGAGKSQLAKQIFELKKQRSQFGGSFVSVNCATLRGDAVSSTLFGHTKGAFTGATADRAGLLREADDGLLFLDEIGELGFEEQAMLLSAIETKHFFPLGSDKEVSSNFQLIAGTNQDLWQMVSEGTFREDLIARLDLWTYHLPALRERVEDIEPNLDFEIENARSRLGTMIRFSSEARERYVRFAVNEAEWRANFRDLNSSVLRMSTLADGGRISKDVVDQEIDLLKQRWQAGSSGQREGEDVLERLLGANALNDIDPFDRVQLSYVASICRKSRSMADAGRQLFAVSREKKTSTNDSHRLKRYLDKFGVSFEGIADS